MGQIEKRPFPLPRIVQVRLIADECTVDADIALFQAAADTLREHRDHNLVDASFHERPVDADAQGGNQLHLYIEPY